MMFDRRVRKPVDRCEPFEPGQKFCRIGPGPQHPKRPDLEIFQDLLRAPGMITVVVGCDNMVDPFRTAVVFVYEVDDLLSGRLVATIDDVDVG
jgi:hypothetical protein